MWNINSFKSLDIINRGRRAQKRHSGCIIVCSAIHDHLEACTKCKKDFSCKAFSIVDPVRDGVETTMNEALHIKYKKPKLNR